MLSKERPERTLIWLLLTPVLIDLLLPGEVYTWTQWLIPSVCLIVASWAIAFYLLRGDWPVAGIAPPPLAFVLLLIAASLSTLFNRVNSSRSRDMFLLLAAYAVLYVACRTQIAARSLRPFLWAIYGVSIAVSVYAIYQYFILWPTMSAAADALPGLSAQHAAALRYRIATKRVFSVFALPTTLSDFLALTFPTNFALVNSLLKRPFRLLLTALPLVANLWALFLSQSFTGFLSLAFCVGVYYLSQSRMSTAIRRRWKLTAVLAVSFIAAFVFLLYVRKLLFVETIAENPLALRLVNWRIGLAAAADHPIIGVGPDNYQTVYTQYMQGGEQQARHAHSAPIEMLAETGIAGGMAFAWLLLLWLRMAWRTLRGSAGIVDDRTGVALAVLALVFQNLLDIGIYFPSQGGLAFVLLGLLHGPPQGEGEQEAETRSSGLGAGWRYAATAAVLALGIASTLLCRRLMLAQLSYRAAIELYARGDDKPAQEKALRSIQLDPQSYEPYELIGSHQLSHRETASEARRAYSSALPLSPLTASLHRGMSLAAAASGAPFLAYMHARRAAELYPGSRAYALDRDRFYQLLQDCLVVGQRKDSAK